MLQLPSTSSCRFKTSSPIHSPHCLRPCRRWLLCRSAASNAGTGFGVPNNTSPELKSQTVKAKWNAVSLAFLGDSVWEVYVRRCFFFPPRRTSDYYEKVVAEVRAESQARYLEQLLAGPILSEEEKGVVQWGRNAKITIPRRFGSNGPHAKTYRAATAIECLIGFLYLTDMQRLQELMAYIGFGMKPDVSPNAAAAVEDVPLQVAPESATVDHLA